MEAGGVEACLYRRSKTITREENRVGIVVQISLGVADGRVSQYT